jgi:5-methylthioribose kinase
VVGADPAQHLLCLEDLGEGGDLTCLYVDGPSPRHDDQLAGLARWLGCLHALPVEAAAMPANNAMRQLNHAHVFEVPFDEHNDVPLSAALRDRQQTLAGDAALRREVAVLGALYLGDRRHTSPPALLHGDYYPGSWLAHPTRTVAVIDPEFGFVGPPEFDVGVFTAHLIMAGFSDDHMASQLTHYRVPHRFSHDLASAFAGVEVIRRLLGVAQLPLPANDATRLGWLDRARRAVLG